MARLTHFSEMRQLCPHCGVSFQPEPGFYFGALYVSYAFTVALFVGVWLALRVLVNPPDWVYLVGIAASAILSSPFSFRASRVLWLYWFGGLQKKSTAH
ncbi:MAG: DUF983 domain-containing protein [Cyclobacteriaceae bacterium]|nr:DUF983 domain-containing protein [Cyclobacteriaceae bacterium]